MFGKAREHYAAELARIESEGLLKGERVLSSPQGSRISVAAGGGRSILNMCANN